MILARDAGRVFVLWLNCVVFHCSCLRRRGETLIRVERSFPGDSVRRRSFAHRAKAATLNAAERRRPDEQPVLFRSSDPAFSYKELPASAAPHLNTNLREEQLLLL